jgi:hypothetical protein
MAEEEYLLSTMILNGENAAHIARRLNRTTRAVRRRAEILKLSWKAGRGRGLNAPRTKRPAFARWKADEELAVEKLFRAGHGEEHISRQLGRTNIAVRSRLYKLGFKMKSLPKDVTAQRDADLPG